jgi:hypothetical protein
MNAQYLFLCTVVVRICNCTQNTVAVCPSGDGCMKTSHKGKKRMKVHVSSGIIKSHMLGKYYNQISTF